VLTVTLLRKNEYGGVMNGNINKDNSNTFGKKLKELRRSRGYTQQSLAEKADIDEKHLSRIENGKYFPTYNTLNKLLNALEVSIEEVGLNLDQLEIKSNPLISKGLQILNSAKSESELSCYIEALKLIQKSIDIRNS